MKNSPRVELLKVKYRTVLAQCEGHEDDRGLFVRCHNLLTEAVLVFESLNIENPIIRVAFSEKYDKELKELEKQAKSLLERGMINKL